MKREKLEKELQKAQDRDDFQAQLRLGDKIRNLDKEQLEFDLVVKKTKEKKGDWLGKWLEKFTEKGTWDLARFRNEKDDWL